jgi:phosphatidate cytidylyltransferase
VSQSEPPVVGPSSHFSDLPKRLLSGVVMIALALWSLFEGGLVFDVFWLMAALLIFWEWQRIVGPRALLPRLLVGGVSLLASAGLARLHHFDFSLLALFVGGVAVAIMAPVGQKIWHSCGVVYAGALILSLYVLRHSVLDGFEAIVWLFALVWGTDVMAYIGGRIMGGPKLWPRVSPSKTWSGFITGITSGALLGVVVLFLLSSSTLSLAKVFVLGLLTCAVAQGGDLLESSIKRHFGVKDASHLIPGHGGLMDRLDGFITASVFAAAIGCYQAGVAAAAHGIVAW